MTFPAEWKIVLVQFLDPKELAGQFIYAILFALFAWIAGRAVRVAVHRSLAVHHSLLGDKTAVTFLGQLVQLAIYVFTLAAYAYLIPQLRHLGAVALTGVGVVSVVVGLAAQNTLGNLIAGISLLLYRPFKLGDRLQVNCPTGLETGTVESLSLGYTTIGTDDGRRIMIPNSVMAGQTSVIISGAIHNAICALTINVSFKADVEKARGLLTKLAAEHSKVTEVLSCRVTALADTGVALTLKVRCVDAAAATDLKCDLLESVKNQFAAQGVPLAYAGA